MEQGILERILEGEDEILKNQGFTFWLDDTARERAE